MEREGRGKLRRKMKKELIQREERKRFCGEEIKLQPWENFSRVLHWRDNGDVISFSCSSRIVKLEEIVSNPLSQ